MISADWGAPEDRFTFSFSSRYQSDRPQAGETVDITDEMLNFTRTLKTGGWLSSFTASIGRGSRDEIGNKERSRKFGAAANFKSSQSGSPLFDITAKFLQDRTSGLNTGNSDIDNKWELRTDSNLFGGRSHDNLTPLPSLSIFFSLKGNAPDEEEKDVNPVDFTAGVGCKVQF